MILTIDKTHELKGNGYLLGVGGENESEQLIIKVAYDVLLTKWAYIEFEQDIPYTTARLTVENGQVVYNIPNGLLKEGHIRVQVVFRDASGFVWKSFKRQFLVSEEINASGNYPQQYPDFITEAQKLLDEITVESEKVDEVLTTEEERKAAELVRAQNEATRQENETARETAEEERKTAETARQTAEEQRQANETERVDAETARRTEFSGWANSLGNLNTYDKRIINVEEAIIGTICDYQADNTTAYRKAVPAKALPYARLNKVGGMTYKENNALTDTLIKSVISKGKNLIDISTAYNGETFISNADGTYTLKKLSASERFTKVMPLKISAGEDVVVSFGLIENTCEIVAKTIIQCVLFYADGTNKSIPLEKGRVVTATKDIMGIQLYLDSLEEVGAYLTFSNLQLEYGTTATEYEPYKANTYAIPEAIQLLDGYGAEGSYIDFERKVFVNSETTTDISAYITDNYIKVYPNGSVVFENDNAQAVPSEIIYTVKR